MTTLEDRVNTDTEEPEPDSGVTTLVDGQYYNPEPTLNDVGDRQLANGVIVVDALDGDEAGSWQHNQLANEVRRTHTVARFGGAVVRFTLASFEEYHPNIVLSAD